mmetsp:Transcript_41643/g.90748  ORF Transcript_41643/g.90748 Transcript_41643/m.90748 type:complete len:384 (-) Transcript_41643:342-1493(-)
MLHRRRNPLLELLRQAALPHVHAEQGGAPHDAACEDAELAVHLNAFQGLLDGVAWGSLDLLPLAAVRLLRPVPHGLQPLRGVRPFASLFALDEVEGVRAEVKLHHRGILVEHRIHVGQAAHSQVVAGDVQRPQVLVDAHVLEEVRDAVVLAPVQPEVQRLDCLVLRQVGPEVHAPVRVDLVVAQVQRVQAVVRVQQRRQPPRAAVADLVVAEVEVREHVAVGEASHQHLDELVVDHVAGQRQARQGLRHADVPREVLGVGDLHAEHRSLVVHPQPLAAVGDGEAAKSRQRVEEEAKVDVRRELPDEELEDVKPRGKDLLLQRLQLRVPVLHGDGDVLQRLLQLQLQKRLLPRHAVPLHLGVAVLGLRAALPVVLVADPRGGLG